MLFYDYKHWDCSKDSSDPNNIGWVFEHPNNWVDSTYGNDLCPSAELYVPEYDVILHLSMDYPNIEDREMQGCPRFIISMWTAWTDKDQNSPYYGEHEPCDVIQDYLLADDDLVALIDRLWSEEGDRLITENIDTYNIEKQINYWSI